MKNVLLFVWEITKIVIIALLIVLPIRYFLFQPYFVRGTSMEPNLKNGDYLIVEQISYRFRDVQRGEVVVFRYPNNPYQRYIKRIIGLPGEMVEIRDGQVIISDQQIEKVLDESDYLPFSASTPGNVRQALAENEYFVLGDNRAFSGDSRLWGPLPEENIIGRALVRAWPFTALARVETPSY